MVFDWLVMHLVVLLDSAFRFAHLLVSSLGSSLYRSLRSLRSLLFKVHIKDMVPVVIDSSLKNESA